MYKVFLNLLKICVLSLLYPYLKFQKLDISHSQLCSPSLPSTLHELHRDGCMYGDENGKFSTFLGHGYTYKYPISYWKCIVYGTAVRVCDLEEIHVLLSLHQHISEGS